MGVTNVTEAQIPKVTLEGSVRNAKVVREREMAELVRWNPIMGAEARF